MMTSAAMTRVSRHVSMSGFVTGGSVDGRTVVTCLFADRICVVGDGCAGWATLSRFYWFVRDGHLDGDGSSRQLAMGRCP